MKLKLSYKEILFQFFVVVLLGVLIAFDKDHYHFRWIKIIFLINYVFIAMIFNYFLLPQYYYKKKILKFILFSCIFLALAIVIEEFVIEKIFFPRSRGRHFNLFASILDIVPVIFLFVTGKFIWDATVKQNKIESLNRLMVESELDYLKQQINPHFLFNNLNNLYSYAIENSPKTPEIIIQLSSILRYMLYDCREKTVSIYKEIENIQAYVQLSELQLEGKGKVNFNVQIDSDHYVAPLILIVFVENAFKHSLGSQSDNIIIDIDIHCSNNELKMKCSNTFESKNNLKQEEGGIGFKNVATRLLRLYPEGHQLKVTNENNLFSVNLTIQLNSLIQ
ncbi:MAG: histidine kinase [Bacteroidales bacterium]|nr:histidine kinase [Bacteroidales bacterium]